MQATHTLERQVIGEIDRRAMERAAAAGEPAPEPEATGKRRGRRVPLPQAAETEAAPGEAPDSEGDPE